MVCYVLGFFFSSRRRHTRWNCDWSSDVCSSDLEPRAEGSRMRSELAEGVRYVLRHPLLRPIAMCTGIGNYFSHIANAVLILYAVRDLGLSAGLIGLWFSVGSLG